MRQVRCGVGLVAAIAIALLAGCATLSGTKPAPDAPASDPGVVAINSAGDAGALGCLLIATNGSPSDVEKARLSVAAAKSVLSDPVPSYSALQTALSAGMPKEYATVSAVVLQRIKVRLGDADIIPDDTVAWGMAESFLAACSDVLQTA